MSSMALTMENNAALAPRETASDVLAAQAKAVVQARYIIAYQRPRDWDQVRQRLLKDCERPSFAETGIYRKPQGNTTVEGLSVRFAEAAQRAMTNIMPERPVIYDDADKRIVRVCMTDLENNVSHFKDLILEKRVERKSSKGRTVISQRTNSYGEVVYLVDATEEELLTKESAMSSKVERQLTLKILPGDIQDECKAAIKATLARADKADPDAAKKRLIDSFDDLGVRVSDLKMFLGVDSLGALSPNELKQLREVYSAIRDGEATWRDFVDQRNAAVGKAEADAHKSGDRAGDLAEKLRQKRSGPQPVATKAADEPPSDTETAIDDLFQELKYDKSMQAALRQQYPDEQALLGRLEEARAEQA